MATGTRTRKCDDCGKILTTADKILSAKNPLKATLTYGIQHCPSPNCHWCHACELNRAAQRR